MGRQSAGREQALTPEEFRTLWDDKAALRAVYRDYYRRIATWARPGTTVEVGAATGRLRETIPQVLASDITPASSLDLVLDAQRLPFANRSVTNIVGVDVLHHIEYPRHFLSEAARALQPGGRIVMIEPAITPVSWLVFKLAHPEPVDLRVDPLAEGRPSADKHPFDSNQALPTLLVSRHRKRLERELPALRVAHAERLSLLAYPLSGGYRRWSLLSGRLAEAALRAERRVESRIGWLAAFRLLLVIERDGDDSRDRRT